MKETALGLLIPEDADSPNGPAQIGGNAEKADALLQAGGVAKSLFLEADVERTSEVMGSLSTPLKVTLPKVVAGQTVEIGVIGFAVGNFQIAAAGSLVGSNVAVGAEEASKRFTIYTNPALANGIQASAERATPADRRDKLLSAIDLTGFGVVRLINKTDRTSYVVELQASKVGAVVPKIKYGYLWARATG